MKKKDKIINEIAELSKQMQDLRKVLITTSNQVLLQHDILDAINKSTVRGIDETTWYQNLTYLLNQRNSKIDSMNAEIIRMGALLKKKP